MVKITCNRMASTTPELRRAQQSTALSQPTTPHRCYQIENDRRKSEQPEINESEGEEDTFDSTNKLTLLLNVQMPWFT